MHAHHPPVVPLAVHLENGQRVYFTEATAMDKATDPAPRTTLTDFFHLCRENEFGCKQLYADLPAFYTWDKAKKVWKRRKTGKPVPPHNVFEMPAIGRVYTVSPRQGECYFLRLLLHVFRGPCSFDDLKNVDGRMCETYREACLQRGLLEDDHHHDDALREAAAEQSTPALRSLFAVIITMCEPSNPIQLWADHHESLCEDFLHRHRQALRDDTAQMNDLILNQCLCDIEANVLMMGGKSLSHYGLPNPERVAANHLAREYAQHVSYDRDQQAELADDQQTLLTDDQRIVFDSCKASVEKKDSGGCMVFLDSPGGTGKTFVINLILATIRAAGKIVLATASSGIAATLLAGGRTLHSTFKIPLNTHIDNTAMCGIKKGSVLAEVIRDCAAIIVDEAPMTHRTAYKAVDRTLRDIRGVDSPIGGIPTLLCGDFRQILLVVRNGTRGAIIDASIKSSHLWRHVRIMHLTANLRVTLRGNTDAGIFSELLLTIGAGNCPIVEHPDVIGVPESLNTVVCSKELSDKVYPNLCDHAFNGDWLSERAILAPLNETVNRINDTLTKAFPGDAVRYVSIDKALTDEEATHYPIEFLNTLEVSGIPPHILNLKLGTPVIIMRSLSPPKTTNGTRCLITKLNTNVIHATISAGPYKGEEVLIPRIPLIPSDNSLPFQFRRLQFSVRPCFAMTINQSQGQTFAEVSLDLSNPAFTH